MEIRTFHPDDSIFFDIPPFPKNVTAWVMEGVEPIGYIAYGTLSSLPGQADLYIYVSPDYRRHRIGTRLFQYLVNHLQLSDITQIAAPYESGQSSLAKFLRHQGCYVEHEEWQFLLTDFRNLPLATTALTHTELHVGAELLSQLYTESFDGKPWFQAYQGGQDVINEFPVESEIVFLYHDEQPIGFVGISYFDDKADLEPLGIIKPYQKQGFGRKFLIAILNYLKTQSVKSVSITAWRSNTHAIKLYRSLGFCPNTTLTYLAFDIIPSSNAISAPNSLRRANKK